MDDEHYEGEVVDFDPETDTHTIHYDDGDVERLCLASETYTVLRAPARPAAKVSGQRFAHATVVYRWYDRCTRTGLEFEAP